MCVSHTKSFQRVAARGAASSAQSHKQLASKATGESPCAPGGSGPAGASAQASQSNGGARTEAEVDEEKLLVDVRVGLAEQKVLGLDVAVDVALEMKVL